MTRTEDRLTDALTAVARGVREETLPPLPARSPAPAPRQWRRWLAPLAAAASVTLIVVLVGAINLLPGTPPGKVAAVAGPPRYYVSVATTGIQVRNTATGAVTARIPTPFARRGSLGAYGGVGIGAGDGGREFVFDYTPRPHVDSTPKPHVTAVQTRLYSFHLTSTGRVAGLSLVKGAPLRGVEAGTALAVSPDGSKVALAGYRLVHIGGHSAAGIVVINLRTGVRAVWVSGLNLPGLNLTIPSISWSPRGDALVFLSQWCHGQFMLGFCGGSRHHAEVRRLQVTGAGGRLSASSVLLSESARYPNIIQARLTPDGKALTMVVLGPPYRGENLPVPQDLQVIQVPFAGGGRPRLLYRSVTGPHPVVMLNSDASGRHLLLTWRLNGWIDHGRLRPLAPQGRSTLTDAW